MSDHTVDCDARPECSHCPPGCKSCWAPDCECYKHQDEPDKRVTCGQMVDGELRAVDVTFVEPGCTCGGMAACLQCQERDATRVLPPEVGKPS